MPEHDAADNAASRDEAAEGGPCPLCGAPMRRRRRDPLCRALGLALLYGGAVLLLLWLPALTIGRLLGVAALVVSGAVLAARRRTWWCPQCWHERPERTHPREEF